MSRRCDYCGTPLVQPINMALDAPYLVCPFCVPDMMVVWGPDDVHPDHLALPSLWDRLRGRLLRGLVRVLK